MHPSKCLVQPHHFFGMGRAIIALLAISGFWTWTSSAQNLLKVVDRDKLIPWCFLCFMIFVVAGPNTSRFVKFIAVMATMGRRTLYRLLSARKPFKPDGEAARSVVLPGYVSAKMTGRALWMEKYKGNMACWRDENWARGSALKAMGPAMKDCGFWYQYAWRSWSKWILPYYLVGWGP